MEKLFLLLVAFSTCYATPIDMSGKVFIFPRRGTIDHVKLQTSNTLLKDATVCVRFQTDISTQYPIFSLATPTHKNEFLLYKYHEGALRLFTKDVSTDFLSVALPTNTWNSVCATWESDTGLAQLWVNGKATIKRFIETAPITGEPITVLGQEQDTYGGGFTENQSFIGMIADVHMWDTVISSADIKDYMAGNYFSPGNVYNWGALEFSTSGKVVVEEKKNVQ